MPFGSSIECVCQECNAEFLHLKKLSEHIKKNHKLSPIDYYIKYFHNGVRPQCIHCGNETRFVSLGDGFKKYCQSDSSIALREAGKIGGKLKTQWNKGLTKESDNRVVSLSGSKNSFYGRKHTQHTINQIADKKRLSFDSVLDRITNLNLNIDINSNVGDYLDQNSLLNITCQTCSTVDSVSLFNLQRCWRCRNCFPVSSRQQMEVVEYVRSILSSDDVIDISTRKIIVPLELDIWIPSKNIAIEYHGLYWHSGGKNGVFDKQRHREKYLACKEKGIKLIQIFSDEWINKQGICKSIIANALGMNKLKLNARDCIVRQSSSKETRPFLDAHHISGGTNATYHYVLEHPIHKIVGVATVRKPIQKKWGKNLFELARMAYADSCTVRGGASKLLSTICKDISCNSEGLLSYADLRFGEGRVYERCGLSRVGESQINYWYTDGQNRFDRFKYRAQNGVSEKEVAKLNNVKPVYGCGNAVYLRKFNTSEP